MYNLLRTKALKDAIQEVIDGVTVTQNSSYDFKEAVIDNAGGIVPSYLWEYHTVEQAKRTATGVSYPFIFQGSVYGFYGSGLLMNLWSREYVPSILTRALYQEVDGALRQHAGTSYRDFGIDGYPVGSSVTNGFTSYFTENGEAIETPLERGFYKFKNFIVPQDMLNSFNLQVIQSGYFLSIFDSCFMLDTDFAIYRGIRLNEPYFYSRAEYNIASRLGYNISGISQNTQYPLCKCFYIAPFIYCVTDDRVVRYVVD